MPVQDREESTRAKAREKRSQRQKSAPRQEDRPPSPGGAREDPEELEQIVKMIKDWPRSEDVVVVTPAPEDESDTGRLMADEYQVWGAAGAARGRTPRSWTRS